MSLLTILMFWSPLVAESLLHIVFAFIPRVLSPLNLTGIYVKFILTPHVVAVIDFAHEHEIQISSIDEGSAKIISSKIFYENDIPFSRNYDFNDVCLGSAAALHSYVLSVPSDEYLSAAWSEEHEVTASPSNEGQDRDAEIEKRNTTSSCKRDGGGNDARGPEDMGAEEECEQIEDSVGEKQVRSLSRLGSRLSEKKGKDCEASTKQDERSCCRGGNDARGPEDMSVEEECEQIEGSVGEKHVRALSRLDSRQSEKKGKAISEASTKLDETLCCRGGNDARGPEDMGVEEECEQIEGSVGDASSEQRIIQEAKNTAAEAKVKVLELQLEASNKPNSAAQARFEALEQEKIKLSEKVEAQRKQLKAKDEELASTQDKAIQKWRQSEEFRQAAQSYARENISRILSDKVAQNHLFKALFKTAYEEDEGQAPRPSAMEEGFARQEHEVTSAPNCEDQDRDGQMEKRNKINSDKEEMGGNNSKKRRCRSRD
ncbi:uncharacterized protein LOC116031473 isoform X2 [Ipomoea triloba]|uniref:uncharacterized protein LOC116031473 isoform X2 n=1 Tax=Ipomoea triloba TaxID=35885 RepID=UPI00125D840C|nr:uncharacterized protein LOC116031473 isoform X2 [Ipomoea triloba]